MRGDCEVNESYVNQDGSIRVIRDSRDSSRDVSMPLEEAQARFDAGELAFDMTHGTFTYARA